GRGRARRPCLVVFIVDEQLDRGGKDAGRTSSPARWALPVFARRRVGRDGARRQPARDGLPALTVEIRRLQELGVERARLLAVPGGILEARERKLCLRPKRPGNVG